MPTSSAYDVTVVVLYPWMFLCKWIVVISVVFTHVTRSVEQRTLLPPVTSPAGAPTIEGAECPLPSPNGRPNNTGNCHCIGLTEIRCSDLTAIPHFRPPPFGSHVGSGGEDRLVIYREIYMARQSIREIGQAAFINVRAHKLVLNFNSIADRLSSNAFVGIADRLGELQISGCGLRSIPLGILTGMTELRHLHLWRNYIERIPPYVFDAAVNLRELVMWGNYVEELGEHSLFGLQHLRRLDLERNRLSAIHKHAFQNQRRLLALHLSDNSLKTLYDETFSSLDGLRSLKLDRNGLEFVYPRSFHGLRNLVSLSLSDNRISFLSDDTFADLRNLSALYLQGNRLEHVWVRTFTGLRALQTLNLSGNRLSNLPDGVFYNSPSLLRLNLDQNRLKTLRRCTVSRTSRVRYLSLIDNPVLCDCPLAWVVDELRDDGREARFHKTSLLSDGGGRFLSSVWGTCESGASVISGEEPSEGETTSKIMSIGNPVNYQHEDCMASMHHECVD